jgi:hypothetical protein
MTTLGPVIAVCLLLLAVPAHATETGDQLLAWCLAGDAGDAAAGSRCLGYIEGAMHAEMAGNRAFKLAADCPRYVTMLKAKARSCRHISSGINAVVLTLQPALLWPP